MTSWEMSDGLVVTDNAPLVRKYNRFNVSNVYYIGAFYNMSVYMPSNAILYTYLKERINNKSPS